MDLMQLRGQIDAIDKEMVALFCRRMEVAAGIADYKKANGMPILVPAREQEKLEQVALLAGPEMAEYAKALYATVFQLSRSYQAQHSSIEVI